MSRSSHKPIGAPAKRLDDEEPTVVARLTELARNRYSAAFRSHTGRWEPLPGTGSLDEMAEVLVTLLQPYLQPDNYQMSLRDVVLDRQRL